MLETAYWIPRMTLRREPRCAGQKIGDSCLNCTGRTGMAACPVVSKRSSVNEIQRELNLPPRLRGCVRPRARRIKIVDQAVVAEIRMVDHVEELRPELHLHPFPHR